MLKAIHMQHEKPITVLAYRTETYLRSSKSLSNHRWPSPYLSLHYSRGKWVSYAFFNVPAERDVYIENQSRIWHLPTTWWSLTSCWSMYFHQRQGSFTHTVSLQGLSSSLAESCSWNWKELIIVLPLIICISLQSTECAVNSAVIFI